MGKVYMTITCDWEGQVLKPADLTALRQLNIYLATAGTSDAPSLPITHFICPAYFTRTYVENDHKIAAEAIKNSGAIKPVDEIGLHIHCWKSLGLQAGILEGDFQIKPLGLLEPNVPPQLTRKNPEGGPDIHEPDLGEVVPLGVYSEEQIKLYLELGIDLVKKHLGVDSVVSYRTGMWVTCDSIFNALATTPLKYEASAFPFNYAAIIEKDYDYQAPMDGWNKQIWSNAQTPGTDSSYLHNSQSFAQYGTGILGTLDQQISQPKAIGTCVEIPDTGALVPVTNSAIMNEYIDMAFQLAESPNTNIFVSIGFHQEEASEPAFFELDKYPLTEREKVGRVNGIRDSVIHALTVAKRKGIPLEFVTIQQAGALLGM